MDKSLRAKFKSYPKTIREQMEALRDVIVKVADENSIADLQECLKWCEPSFITKSGSTVRIDWKENTPDSIYVFFHCKTKLVDTFRELYPDQFEYTGIRAIVLRAGKKYPVKALKHCISLALNYHRVKHLPLLGA